MDIFCKFKLMMFLLLGRNRKPKIQASHPGQDMNSHCFKSLDCLESKAGDLCAEILNFCWDGNGGERTEMGVWRECLWPFFFFLFFGSELRELKKRRIG
jgi:hypothetical protein